MHRRQLLLALAQLCAAACAPGSAKIALTSSSASAGASAGTASATGASVSSTGGGSSSTSAGTSGGSGSSGATGCAPENGGSWLSPCIGNADCNCPLRCGLDPTQAASEQMLSGSVCLPACATPADCPDPGADCVDGLCLVSVCAGDAGPFYGSCVSPGGEPGTCFPSQTDPDGTTFGICVLAGTSDAGCDPTGTFANRAALCQSGELCAADPASDGGLCLLQCDPTGPFDGGCSAGEVCSAALTARVTLVSPAPQSGSCVPSGPGGCAQVGAAPTELAPCSDSRACACPQTCVHDDLADASYCALPCAVTATDCPTLQTACRGGSCLVDYCAFSPLGAALSGSYGAPCASSSDGGDGFCLAVQPLDLVGNPSGTVYGVCLQSGGPSGAPAGQACDLEALRDAGTQLCASGDFCQGGGGDGLCVQGCDPTAASDTCGAGNGCFPLYADQTPGLAPSAGLCQMCSAPADACGTSSECCSSSCVDGGPNGLLCQ